MFSNSLVKSIVSSASDEASLKLSKDDWHLVLNANKEFSIEKEAWIGNSVWGRYLLNKIGGNVRLFDVADSLELCCGNGFMYFSLKEICKYPSGSSHYIDLSKSQTDAFAERCRLAGVEAPHIICGDIGELPFENESLQLVYGNSFLHHLPDVGRYLREVHRVLEKGGGFIAFHEPTATATFWESFPRSLFRNVDMGSLTDIWLIKSNVITRLLLEAGFNEIKVYPNGLLSSLLVTPWQILLAKLGISCHSNVISAAKTVCDKVERGLPNSVLSRFAPSIAVVARK